MAASFIKLMSLSICIAKDLDNKILETVANPLNTNTVTLNLSFLPGAGAPSYVLNIQSIGKNNEKEADRMVE